MNTTTVATAPGIGQDLLNYLTGRDQQRRQHVRDTWQAMTPAEQDDFRFAAVMGFSLGYAAAKRGRMRCPLVKDVVDAVQATDISIHRPTGPQPRRARRLYREAAVMGWVQGIDEVRYPAPGREKLTTDTITAWVLLNCLDSCVDDLYPAVNHLQLNNIQNARRAARRTARRNRP